MRVIRLKKHWSSEDSTLVVNDRMTECGLAAYWRGSQFNFPVQLRKERHLFSEEIRPEGPGTQVLMICSHHLIAEKLNSTRIHFLTFLKEDVMLRIIGILMKTTDTMKGAAWAPKKIFGVRRQNNWFLLPRLENQF